MGPIHIQLGTVKLGCWCHWMHVAQVHPVTSASHFHCPKLNVITLSNCRQGLLVQPMSASSVQCRHWSRHVEKARLIPRVWVAETCRTKAISSRQIAMQPSHSADRVEWRSKMASLVLWIPWCIAHIPMEHWAQLVDGDLAESIKRSASHLLGVLVPQVRARTSPGFFTTWRF